MAATEAAALDIRLHPLVVLSVADHYTREYLQYGDGRRCCGLLFGHQEGRSVQVVETVEITQKKQEATTKGNKSEPVIEQEAVEVDMKLFSEAYPNHECLGWYTSGGDLPTEYDRRVLHQQMKKYNERPLLLLMNPKAAKAGMRDLPMQVFEEAIHVIGDKTTSEFVKTAHSIQADEAERITVTYCAKVVNQEEAGSAVLSHYATMIKSVQSLHDRVSVVHRFLCDVRDGKINVHTNQDQQLLRDIKGLCLRLPVMNADAFRSDLLSEYNDALLVTLLASITKGTHMQADVSEKFSIAFTQKDDIGIGGSSSSSRRGMLMDDDFHVGAGDRRGGGGSGKRGDDGGKGIFSSLMGAFTGQ